MLLVSGVTREQLEDALGPSEDEPTSIEERRSMILRAGGEIRG